MRGLLSEGELRLFLSMERRDQRHAIEVMRRLGDSGNGRDTDLLVAALLHDCGKGAAPLWLRIAYVVAPGFVARFSDEPAGGWRSAAARLGDHGERGGRLAAAAGASPAVVRLVAGDTMPEERVRAAALRAADDAS